MDSQNVEVVITGGVFFAPLGSTLPTDSNDPLDESFTSVGYISEDGITETPEVDTTEIKAMQNGDTVRTIQTEHSVSYGFTMLETNDASMTLYYGNYDDGAFVIDGRQMEQYAVVIETFDRGQVRRRLLPVAQVTDRGEVALTNDEATGYEVTITAYPDETGAKVYGFAPVAADGYAPGEGGSDG